jgi:hypothetical protein
MNIWLIFLILLSAVILMSMYRNGSQNKRERSHIEDFRCASPLNDEFLIEENREKWMKLRRDHECPVGWQRNTDKGVVYNSGIPPAIKWLPKGLDKYPPPTSPPQGKPQPPLWKWKSFLNYMYYDPWFAYSSPYNFMCDAYARRNCNGSWETRTCYRNVYNKCITEKLY